MSKRLVNGGNLPAENIIDVTCDNYSITDNITHETVTGTQQSGNGTSLLIGTGSWWFQSLQVWESDVLVFDGHAAVDDEGNACVHDAVSGNFFTNDNLTLVAEEEYNPGF